MMVNLIINEVNSEYIGYQEEMGYLVSVNSPRLHFLFFS